MRCVFVSRDHAARLDAARRYLVEREGPILVLGATKRAADDFVKTAGPGPGADGLALLGVHRLTLDLLARELALLPFARSKIARLTGLGAAALAARVVHATRQNGALQYFEPVADTPGFGSAVARTIRDVREAEVEAAAIEALGSGGVDLRRLLATYERELWSLGLADRAQMLRVAADVAGQREHPLVRLPVVMLDVWPETVAETRLMKALAPDEVVATAPVHDRDRVERLAALLGAKVEDVDAAEDDRALDRARRYVFLEEHPEAAAPDDSLTFFSAPGEARECIEIVRRIERLAARGVPFDRMAVLLRNERTYTPLLMDALGRARIPGFFTRGVRRPDPSGRALLALLSCAAEGLSASRFAEYLSLGRTPEVDAAGAPVEQPTPWVPPKEDGQLVFFTSAAPPPAPTPPAERRPIDVPVYWEKLLVDAAVIGGRERWARRLGGLARELKLQIQRLGEDAGTRRRKKEQDLEQVENLTAFALPLIDLLDQLPEAATWRVWLEKLGALATRALDDPEPVLTLLAELRPMSDVGPVGLDEVRLVLDERLGFLREEPTGSRFSKVFVAPIEEARGRSFDVVFLPGLAEGIFPRRVYEDPLLLDGDRRRIDPDFVVQARELARERDRLHTALGAAEQAVFVSYPRMNVIQGRPRVPSFYAVDVLRAAEGRVLGIDELFERGTSAADARLGWPAPRRAEEAIDEAEYDLAILGPLVFEAPEAVKSRGRYLVEGDDREVANQHLVRGLRWYASRSRSAWRPGDGLVAPDERTHEVLGRHRLGHRSYSPTALQSYATCPYRFLLHAVHYLRPREEAVPLEDVDPLTRGSLFHHVQYELFLKLRAAELLPVDEDGLDPALAILEETFAEASKQFEEDLAPAIPRVWSRHMDALRTELRAWLRSIAAKQTAWRPIHAELAFGLKPGPGRDPQSTPRPAKILDAYEVRGAIDLVEEHVETGAVRVTDHKTGRTPSPWPATVGGGRHLQPLVYGLAAEHVLGREVQEGRLFYCTTRENFSEVVIPVNDATKGKLREVLETIDDALEKGFLPVAPDRGACRYCDYRAVCGPGEEERLRRKRPDELEPLVKLRGMS
ncbi:MAG: PD-(D/E)XK nuclease family protein [Deltaproteobacteria bacterium]